MGFAYAVKCLPKHFGGCPLLFPLLFPSPEVTQVRPRAVEGASESLQMFLALQLPFYSAPEPPALQAATVYHHIPQVQLCPCFALLSNRSCLSKNLMQEYNSFISRMLRLEGTLKTISSQSPAMSRDTSHYIRLLKALYNMAWKHCQVWGIHNIPGQPLSVSHHPDSKEFLPNT